MMEINSNLFSRKYSPNGGIVSICIHLLARNEASPMSSSCYLYSERTASILGGWKSTCNAP